ncbi:MAG TPA: methyltransferase domain-containing protein [Longimicrobiales bacterium]|nr:methyltransferase domain-containing protein [Longimicrobiales bacterium]
MPEKTSGALDTHGPSAVGLTRLSKRLSFPPGGEALYRYILRLVALEAKDEFVVVPCGRGAGAVFVARVSGASGAGVDPDPALVEVASQRAKNKGVGGRVHFEAAPPHDLPYQDAVFDLALGEIDLAAAADPPAAVRELARVTRPGGTVVLIQLVWMRALDPGRSGALIGRLGVRPRLVVEWKQMLRDAGITDLVVEDWSDAAGSHHQPSVLGGLAELFTFRGKLRLLPRAWKRWGWRGVRAVLSREQELRREVQDERVLGVSVIKGIRGVDDAGRDRP